MVSLATGLPKIRNPESGIRNLRPEILKPGMTKKKKYRLKGFFLSPKKKLTIRIKGQSRPSEFFAPFGSEKSKIHYNDLIHPRKLKREDLRHPQNVNN